MHRYYEPDTGRYITADPIGLNGGVNVYAYVGGNPVNWVDPWGLDVTNNSPTTTFYVKPEHGTTAVPVNPGGTYEGPVDGITAPNGSGGQDVIKTRGPFGRGDITIDNSGYNLRGPDFLNDLIGGGKKDQSWLEDRHREVPPDHGWDDLFDKCK